MTIPENIVSDLISSTSSVLNGFSNLIIILFSVGIVFYISRGLVNLLPK